MPINYIVISRGHISFFTYWEQAKSFANEFDGILYNVWGLMRHG